MAEITRRRRLPSVAFIVTLLTGLFFLAFGIAESVSGFAQRPISMPEAVGGLMEAARFGLSFLVIAWLLWVRPMIGGVILVALGIGFAIWMYIGWNLNNLDWYIATLLVGLPIVLGAFTTIRELLTRRM